MVEFETNTGIDSKIEIQFLYAIRGVDERGMERLLVVGKSGTWRSERPVIELTSCLHTCKFYDKKTSAAEVCEAFGINPQTASYFYDYEDFSLVFRPSKKED